MRKAARKHRVAIDDNRDPAAEKATKKAASALVLSSVIDDYLTVRSRALKPRSLYEVTRHLRKDWKPLHGLALNAITRDVIAAHQRKIAERGAAAANRARSSLSAMFGWAVGEGLCDANPVIGMNKIAEAASRDRVLSDAELVKIWKATAGKSSYHSIVRLLMLTGQRREEIGALRWSEFNRDEALIELPKERAKNGRAHTVPLSDSAMDVLDGVVQRDGRDLVFGEGTGGWGAWSRGKKDLDAAVKIKDWTLHDLRRTAATRMADLGVLPHVIEAVLNHVSGHQGGVAGIYNRSTYAKEKREALEVWATHIKTIVAQSEGANVVAMKKRRV